MPLGRTRGQGGAEGHQSHQEPPVQHSLCDWEGRELLHMLRLATLLLSWTLLLASRFPEDQGDACLLHTLPCEREIGGLGVWGNWVHVGASSYWRVPR